MDKQGRLTKWNELEIGATYEWVKGNYKYGLYRLLEIDKHERHIALESVAPNEKDGSQFRQFNWQRRFRKVEAAGG